MKDRSLKIAVCRRRTDLTYSNQQMTWSELCTRLSQTKRTAETVAEYKAMSKDDQSAIKDVGGFVLGDLEGGKRSNTTVLSRSAVCLDLDFAKTELWDQLTMLFPWAVAIYSTHKHTLKTPKYRVIIPLSRDVSPEEYEAIGRKLADDYMDIEWCDDTTFQPSRMMFWPSTSSDGEYVFEKQDGDLLDPDEILSLYGDRWNDISLWPFSSRVERKRDEKAKRASDPLAKNGPVGWFCKAYTIQEAIETFIPDVYTPTDKDNRWTYAAGTTSGGFVIYDNGTQAYSNHMSDPCGDMHCVNAFDMVRIHKFGSLDTGSKAFGINLPSYKAMVELVQQDPKVQQIRASEMFDAQVEKMAADETGIDAETFKKENEGWQALLIRHPKTGKIEETIENVVTILEHDTKLKELGRFNEFQDFPEKTGTLPWWKWDPFSKEWSDNDTKELMLYLERFYGIRSERIVKHGRDIVHTRRKFHPVRDYLDGLQWDGVERLDTLLIDYMAAEDTAYTRAVTRKTLTAAVKRIYEPGCKMDYVLTLAGRQGLKKTSFFRNLVPDSSWFSDSLDTFQGKEAYEALQGSWILELAELSAAKRSDVERTKQFITKQDDKYRKAYAEKQGRYRRQCVFVATTNSTDFLRDMTGNRRWWIVPATGKGTKDAAEDLPKERDQLFAEAKYRYQQGEKLYLPDEIEALANEMQEEYTYRSVKYDQIAEFLDLDLPEEWKDLSVAARRMWLDTRDKPGIQKRDKVCLLEIWQEVFDGNKSNFPNTEQREIADILQKLGWKRGKAPRNFKSEYGKQRAFLPPENWKQ